MVDYLYESERDLSTLPLDYSLDIALENKDIISYGVKSYHTMRLQLFMDHTEKYIPDKVRITEFGTNGTVIISILQYDGSTIVYSQRHVIENSIKYATYTGYRMKVRLKSKKMRRYKQYLLCTFSNIELIVFQEKVSSLKRS